MSKMTKQKISWLGTAAIGLGGANLTIYTLNSIVATQGTVAVLLVIFAFFLTIFASFGYLELVLMYPNKVGGISAACEEGFRSYNPIMTNIIGVGYWLAWLMAASFASLYASTLMQKFFFPSLSINWCSTVLIIVITILNLGGLRWVQRFAIPIAAIAALSGFIITLYPIITDSISWEKATHFSLLSTISGDFGQLTSLMAGLYLLGWIVPGYECSLCYVGETIEPEKNVSRAMYACIFLASFYYGIYPFIWLGFMGPDAMAKDLTEGLISAYSPLINGVAKIGIVWFMIFNLFICLFAPLGGPPRTLAQLAKDGLVPEFFSLTSSRDVPWLALLITAFIAIAIIWAGAPTWLIAATNFQYLLCITSVSFIVWILRKTHPEKIRPYRAPTIFIYLGLFSAIMWLISTIFGFQQYGLSTMIIGITFAFIGIPLYFWRYARERYKNGLTLIPRTLHIKLTGTLIIVLLFDAIGYLIAVHNIDSTHSQLMIVLQDIFVVVALMTLTVGLILPGMIIHVAGEINEAAKRIIKNNLTTLSFAMEKLGSGNLEKTTLNYDVVPIKITTHDEIGEMAKSFNIMQDEIRKTAINFENVRVRLQKAITELKELNKTLEKKVEERTWTLATSNEKLTNEISMREAAQQKASSLHNELMVAARRAGMAEIATNTLHNVGNVLSSISTSSSMVYEKLANSEIDNLVKLANLLKEHGADFKSFITEDPKGKLIPNYIISLADTWVNNKAKILTEVNELKKYIEHINNIISMQQSLSGALGMVEEVSIPEVIADAIALNKMACRKEKIEIILDLQDINTVIQDRVRLLQILVNLIKNSIDALVERQNEDKKIFINVYPVDKEYFQISVQDNGCGILPENLVKIFLQGFTTKKTGHGFGLHGSANTAKALGGSLVGRSEGEGKGATFTLTLPYKHEDK